MIRKKCALSEKRTTLPSQVVPFLLMSLILTACGGGSSEPTGGDPNSSDSMGTEPRIQLQLTTPAQARLVVSTVSEQNVSVNEETSSRSISTVINVDAVLKIAGEVFQLDTIRELESFSPDELRPLNLELARITGKYNINGQSLGYDQEQNLFDVLVLDSFSLPQLTLSHPQTPIGVGAKWTDRNSTQSINSTIVTQVDALTSSSISVSKTIDTGSDDQNRYVVAGTMSAVYSLPSLLLKSADINIAIRFEDQLYINGVLQPVVDNSTFVQTIREAVE